MKGLSCKILKLSWEMKTSSRQIIRTRTMNASRTSISKRRDSLRRLTVQVCRPTCQRWAQICQRRVEHPITRRWTRMSCMSSTWLLRMIRRCSSAWRIWLSLHSRYMTTMTMIGSRSCLRRGLSLDSVSSTNEWAMKTQEDYSIDSCLNWVTSTWWRSFGVKSSWNSKS